jgi:thiol-disulfide isomerase/thioredoxin
MSSPNMKKPFATLPLFLVVLAGALGIYWFQSEPRKAEVTATTESRPGLSKDLAKGAMAGVIIHAAPKPIETFSFTDAAGKQVDLSQWKGRVVLLNLWATWCAPCRKEMPDLAKLQAALGGPDFEVVALSVDRKGLAASQAFLQEIGVTTLKVYSEPEAKSLAALQALGLPATVLIDRKGLEAGRLLGPADWASPEAQALVKALLDQK